ncbi:MAG: hypothetical protein ACOCYC_05075, partial [bacterium]
MAATVYLSPRGAAFKLAGRCVRYRYRGRAAAACSTAAVRLGSRVTPPDAGRVFVALALFVLSVLAVVAPAAGAQGYETRGLSAEVDRMYREAGRVPPSVSDPPSTRELARSLERLLHPDTPDPIRLQAQALLDAVGGRGGGVTGPAVAGDSPVEVSVDLLVQPEYYNNLPRTTFAAQARGESPAAELALGLGHWDGAFLHIEAAAQREWSIVSPTNIPAPVEGNPLPFENNLVREGYLFLPLGPLDVAFGRQDLAIGPDPDDSLYVSRRVPFLDALRATMRLGPVKMTSVTSTLENGRADPDVSLSTLSDGDGRVTYGFDTSTILYNIHYFEYTWRRLRLGLGSQVVIARPLNSFHLADFFPVFSWHNADITPNNMSLVGDLSVCPLPGLEVFLQYGYDDISGETFGFGDSSIPTIPAYIGGVQLHDRRDPSGRPTADRGRPLTLDASALVGYTHYLWGNFDDSEALSRAIYRLEADGPRQSMPLTSP